MSCWQLQKGSTWADKLNCGRTKETGALLWMSRGRVARRPEDASPWLRDRVAESGRQACGQDEKKEREEEEGRGRGTEKKCEYLCVLKAKFILGKLFI